MGQKRGGVTVVSRVNPLDDEEEEEGEVRGGGGGEKITTLSL